MKDSKKDIEESKSKKEKDKSNNNFSIKYELEDLENKSYKDKINETYEENNLTYDRNGIILFNKENGIELIKIHVAKILSKTIRNSKYIVSELEGGLGHIGIDAEDREKIIVDALELVNKLTEKNKKQLERSLSRKGKKRGFSYIKKHYKETENIVNSIVNIKNIIWNRSIENKDFEIIKIQYLTLVSRLFEDITKEEERIFVLEYIDEYFNAWGIGLNERFKLLKSACGKYKLKEFGKIIKRKVRNDKKAHGLVKNGKLNLNKELHDILKKNNDNYQLNSINKQVQDLEIQLSMTRIKSNYPNLQPLINLIERPSLPSYKRIQIAAKYLRENDYLKKTKDGNYIFDDQTTNSYIAIDGNKLGDFLTKKYPILKLGIESKELNTILGLSGEFDELHNEFYIFNNGILNLHERKFTKTQDFKDYFTIKKMDCKLDLNEINIDITNPPSCLVDRVLREILIPDYEEGKENLDDGYYIDFLQRLGSAFNTRIKEKKFACYYGGGDNGKDILIEILKMAFADRFLLATMDILEDEKADLTEYDVVILDELNKNSFKYAIAFIKRITGGEEDGTAKRQLYTNEVFRPKNPSAFFLFTNEIPAVPLSETAFYRREDVLKLQNHFIENPNKDKANEFQADSSLKDKIKNSKEDSLEWLINASIKAYYDCHDENGYFKGFTKAQTAEETKMIVSNTDPLKKFLRETYVIDEDREETIANRDIITSYENYCQRNDLTINTKNLAIIMGNAIKSVFGDVKKKSTNDTLYYLNIKSESDNNITYHIDSNYTWYRKKDEIPENDYENYEKVYIRIDEISNQGLTPTKKQLKEEFKHLDIEDILSKLESIELIFKGKQ